MNVNFHIDDIVFDAGLKRNIEEYAKTVKIANLK